MHAARRAVVVVASALTLALLFQAGDRIGAKGSLPLAGPSPISFPAAFLTLYRTTYDLKAVRAMDPQSLGDLSRIPTIRIGNGRRVIQPPRVVATPDGSKFSVLHQLRQATHPTGQDQSLQLYEAATGMSLSRVNHPAVPLWSLGMSADGSILYGFGDYNNFNQPCASSMFYLLNSRTGRVVRRLSVAAHLWDAVLVNSAATRLYVLSTPDQIDYCAPSGAEHPTVLAYDLATGKSIGALKLNNVLAGDWNTSRVLNDSPVGQRWHPGFALSPDGSQLAVMDGHNDTLTIVRTKPFRVAGSERISPRPSTFDSLLGLLDSAPGTAEAKGEAEGSTLQLQYTPGGRSLVVTGNRLHPSKAHPYSSSEQLGIRLVDIASGTTRAWFRSSARFDGVWTAPDGSAIYSTAPMSMDQDGMCPCYFQRRDPSTLRVRARRIFYYANGIQPLFLRRPR